MLKVISNHVKNIINLWVGNEITINRYMDKIKF
jgi:hypothetical protein